MASAYRFEIDAGLYGWIRDEAARRSVSKHDVIRAGLRWYLQNPTAMAEASPVVGNVVVFVQLPEDLRLGILDALSAQRRQDGMTNSGTVISRAMQHYRSACLGGQVVTPQKRKEQLHSRHKNSGGKFRL